MEAKELLREYGKHKDKCSARRRYFVPECPHCGSTKNHWRQGVHFEHERICGCGGPAYVPEERRGECTCGYDQALAALEEQEPKSSHKQPCDTCKGSKKKHISGMYNMIHKYIDCPDCPGTGIKPEQPCQPKPSGGFVKGLRNIVSARTSNIPDRRTVIDNVILDVADHIEQLKAEKAKADVLIAFYLEGLEKSDEEITALKQKVAELKKLLKSAQQYIRPLDPKFEEIDQALKEKGE